jgi:hypothetical protein
MGSNFYGDCHSECRFPRVVYRGISRVGHVFIPCSLDLLESFFSLANLLVVLGCVSSVVIVRFEYRVL